MKRFFILTALLLPTLFTVKADERAIDLAELPKAAQEFLSSNFAGVPIKYATVDREVMDTDYEVRLDDGTKIDFNGKGNWTEISNKRSGISINIIPPKLVDYVRKEYPQASFITIERDKNDYEIKLSNGVELTFNLDGKLIGFDD